MKEVFLLNQCLFITQILIRYEVHDLTQQELKIPHFNM